MNVSRILVITALASCGFATAAPVFTDPVGYVSITCPPKSDTIVGLPLRATSAYIGSLNANPTLASGSATLTLSGSPALTTNEFAGAYYVKFKDTTPTAAAGDGQWFSITANTANTITVDLNGGAIAAVSGARLEVFKFWTLAELFPPAECTTSPTTTGNAIVATTSTLSRKTQVLMPDFTTTGINIAPSSIYYVYNKAWRKAGQSVANDFGAIQFWPDAYFIIRNPSNVPSATTYTVSGEVELGSFIVPLSTQASIQQDNFIGIPRAVDVTLNQLGLGGTSAFVTTTSTLSRKDTLLTFNNSATGTNKSASAIYYYYNGAWRKSGSPVATNFGSDVIPAGSGFVIRKYQSGNGLTRFWGNVSTY